MDILWGIDALLVLPPQCTLSGFCLCLRCFHILFLNGIKQERSKVSLPCISCKVITPITHLCSQETGCFVAITKKLCVRTHLVSVAVLLSFRRESNAGYVF